MYLLRWFWRELHRTDLGDDEHYPNGFRKFSCFEPIQYAKLIVALLSLVVAIAGLIATLVPK